MLVIAKSVKGKEFLYDPRTAHQVSEKHGAIIAERLNNAGFELKLGEVWALHEIDHYSAAYTYADSQGVTLSRKGKIKVYRYHG